MSDQLALVPDRSCDGCTLCCKVIRIESLNKPKSVWCTHCAVGKGCKIYESRPGECAGFFCGWRRIEALGDHWFPADSKIVVLLEHGGTRIGIHVDPGSAGAWRKEPYYSEIKKMAVAGIPEGRHVVVVIGHRAIAVFPDKEIDLGVVAEDEIVVTSVERRNLDGAILRATAEKRKANAT